jgi:SAM-dependent methyltransferase
MDPDLFRPRADSGTTDPLAVDSLSTTRALDALPAGERSSVIDVGCGGGAATMAVADRLANAIGVDQSTAMLDVFIEEAEARGIEARGVVGTWPSVADEAGDADLVLCHHVAYNVAELGPFVIALDRAARRRVVMELTLFHPQTANTPLWQHFWGLDRPTGPTAEDALAVVKEAGIDARLEIGPAGSLRRDATIEARAVTAARMLCLGPDRLPEVEAAVRALPPRSDQRAVIWWDPPTP